MKKVILLFVFLNLMNISVSADDLEWFLTNYQLKTPENFITELNNLNIGETLRVRLIVRYMGIGAGISGLHGQGQYLALRQNLRAGEVLLLSDVDRRRHLYILQLEYPSNNEYSFTINELRTPHWNVPNNITILGNTREVFIRFDKIDTGISYYLYAYRDVRLNDFGIVIETSNLIEIDWDAYMEEYGHLLN